MPRICTACAHADRDAIDRALIRGVPKRQIAASHGLADSALGRHARSHLPRALLAAEDARAAASADALLGETLTMQAKALDLMAQAEAEGDVRGAIVALKEARECLGLRSRIAAELRVADAGGSTTFAEIARGARERLLAKPRRVQASDAFAIRVEYVEPVDALNAELRAPAERPADGQPGSQ